MTEKKVSIRWRPQSLRPSPGGCPPSAPKPLARGSPLRSDVSALHSTVDDGGQPIRRPPCSPPPRKLTSPKRPPTPKWTLTKRPLPERSVWQNSRHRNGRPTPDGYSEAGSREEWGDCVGERTGWCLGLGCQQPPGGPQVGVVGNAPHYVPDGAAVHDRARRRHRFRIPRASSARVFVPSRFQAVWSGLEIASV